MMNGQLEQPVPFEIVEGVDGMKVASNGSLRVMVAEPEGRMFRRRGIQGLATKPPAEQLLPHLNALAGELLQRPDMPAEEAVGRLLALAGVVPTAAPRRIEWLVAELNGVRVYTDGLNVILSTKELSP